MLLKKVFNFLWLALLTIVAPRTIAWWWASGSRKKTIALENLSGQSLKVIAAAFRACLLLCLSSTTQFKLHCTLNYSQCSWFPDKLRCSLILSCNRLFFRFFYLLVMSLIGMYFINTFFWQNLYVLLLLLRNKHLTLAEFFGFFRYDHIFHRHLISWIVFLFWQTLFSWYWGYVSLKNAALQIWQML